MAIVAREAELKAAQKVVWDLMHDTDCLAEVKGCDVPELVRGIAVGIARERERVAECALSAARSRTGCACR